MSSVFFGRYKDDVIMIDSLLHGIIITQMIQRLPEAIVFNRNRGVKRERDDEGRE